MTHLSITPWYGAILVLVYIAMSANVIRGRGKHKVNLGSGGVSDMERRIRIHGNFAEYVPLTLLMIVMDELRGLNGTALHLLCLGLTLGRLSHAWGISSAESDFRFRVGGMALTLTALALAALAVPFTG